jgi:hypothetical protein
MPRNSSLADFACLLLCLTFQWACAPRTSPPDSRTATGYERLGDGYEENRNFEVAPAELDPQKKLPPALFRGAHHVVLSITLERDFSQKYRVSSSEGIFEVRSMGLLRKRVHELERLWELREAGLEDREVYVLALANAAESPLEGGMQLLLHPIQTTSNIPRGIWKMARGYYEMTSAGRTYLEDDYIDELIGFGRAKRSWAYRLGVDVYSAYPPLQTALDRYGWLSLAGGLSVRLPLIAVPGGASIALSVSNTSDDMKRELRDKTPEEIRLSGRRILVQELEVDEVLADEFVTHPWYSPSRLATLIESLASLEKAAGFSAFISSALLADNLHETHSFTRLAQLFSAYHQRVAEPNQLFSSSDLILARTAEGEVILPFCLDSAYWTPSAAEVFNRLELDLAEREGITGKTLLISGTLSPRTRSEVEKRGWKIMEDLQLNWLAEIDAATFEAGGADEERILPEIGS